MPDRKRQKKTEQSFCSKTDITGTEKMISLITHEIRNPLAVIHSFLQIFFSDHPEFRKEASLVHIQENVHYLEELLNQLSCYNSSHTVRFEEKNPYLLLQEITAEAGSTLEEKQVSLELIKESPIPRVELDPIKFRQLFYNLIRNSAEAMPQGGTIHIHLFFDGSQVIFSVCDNGIGIPEQDLSSLFDPFVTHKENGTGLGLAICKEIVSRHHGTIQVSSKQGEGTVFTICLPLCQSGI